MAMSQHRKEASGPGWREHFVDAARAAGAASVGAAVAQSVSYVTIANFASAEERRALMDSAADAKSRSACGRPTCSRDGDATTDTSAGCTTRPTSSSNSASGSHHVLFASGTNNNCDRYSVETLLDDGARAASAALLRRLLSFLDGSDGRGGDPGDHPDFVPGGGGERMSVLAKAVFGTSSELDARLGLGLRDREVVWYDEPDEAGKLHPEPKVNVYSEGGYFAQHGDGMDLTLLVVLTDSNEFEGGGTAFYRDLDLVHEDLEGDDDLASMSNASHSLDPESIARPDAGTAMIWGGTLQHMALPVTKGTRAVYVGSFNLT